MNYALGHHKCKIIIALHSKPLWWTIFNLHEENLNVIRDSHGFVIKLVTMQSKHCHLVIMFIQESNEWTDDNTFYILFKLMWLIIHNILSPLLVFIIIMRLVDSVMTVTRVSIWTRLFSITEGSFLSCLIPSYILSLMFYTAGGGEVVNRHHIIT